jgi:hypothetical protein
MGEGVNLLRFVPVKGERRPVKATLVSAMTVSVSTVPVIKLFLAHRRSMGLAGAVPPATPQAPLVASGIVVPELVELGANVRIWPKPVVANCVGLRQCLADPGLRETDEQSLSNLCCRRRFSSQHGERAMSVLQTRPSQQRSP